MGRKKVSRTRRGLSPFYAYFDGACEPTNPYGNMGVGACIYARGKPDELAMCSEFYPADRKNSNNVAEYLGLSWILHWFIDNELSDKPIDVYGDSMLVVQQMEGRWRIKRGLYVDHALECLHLVKGYFPNIHFYWIPREDNVIADQLSKECMKEHGVVFMIQPERE